MGKVKKLMDEIQEFLDEPGELNVPVSSPEEDIELEPELYIFDFLELQCYEHQIGKAMAMRNYWACRCLQ